MTWKVLAQSKVSSSIGANAQARDIIYTVPAGKTATIKEILGVDESQLASTTFQVYMLKSGGVDDTILGTSCNNDAQPITGLWISGTFPNVFARNTLMNTGDVLKLKRANNTAGALTLTGKTTISGDES